jgi:hypothetical protein
MKYRIMETESFGGSGGFSRSKVLGAPVLLIFGIGLMLAGQILTGLALIGVAIFFLLIALSPAEWKALWLALAALIFGCVFGIQAVLGTIKGQTTYTNFQNKQPMELVARNESPEKFRSAIKARWALAGIGWLGAAGGFAFYRAWTKED